MKKSVSDIFDKIQAKIGNKPEFKLDKNFLKVSKRFELDLKKYGFDLMDPLSLLKTIKPLVFEKFKKYPITKQQITLECTMSKTNPATGEETKTNAHFHSHYEEIYEGTNFDETFDRMKDKINASFENYMNNSSQWKFHKSSKIFLNINNIKKLKASSYIPLSSFLAPKKAIVNPRNNDQKCFLYCIGINELLKTTPDLRNAGRITEILRKKVESFNIKGMEFPCGFGDVDKFKKKQ